MSGFRQVLSSSDRCLHAGPVATRDEASTCPVSVLAGGRMSLWSDFANEGHGDPGRPRQNVDAGSHLESRLQGPIPSDILGRILRAVRTGGLKPSAQIEPADLHRAREPNDERRAFRNVYVGLLAQAV